MVTKDHRLCDLKMGEARHDGLGFFLCQRDEYRGQCLDLVKDLINGVPKVQADIGCDLVVSRSSGVQDLSDLTDAIDESRLNIHVDVFKRH